MKCCNNCCHLALDEGRRCYGCGCGHAATIADPTAYGTDCYDHEPDTED